MPKVLPDDAPEDALEKYMDKDGNITMPFRAFKTRLMRATKADLKKMFGTDDRDAILKQKDEYEQLLTERERLEAAVPTEVMSAWRS